MNNQKVVIFTLVSGVMIMGRVLEENEIWFYLDFPMEMNLTVDAAGDTRLYVSRYLPYSEDGHVVVFSNAVESLVIANQEYASFYTRKVAQSQEAAIGDLDTNSTAATPNSLESDEMYDQEEASYDNPYDLKSNTTIH